ncbi:MAG: toxic anion resistance protein [Lachnospiraceae bacterium]|nr:toxic anion resistance protein [Lachnospiraceae bacterium]
MSENENNAAPTLVFDAQPQEQEAPKLDAAEPAAPSLVFEQQAAPEEAKVEKPLDPEESKLTDAEKAQVEAFSKQIDLNNSNAIIQYGAGAQKKIADFSTSALESVKTKDLGEVGKLLSGVVVDLKSIGDDEEEKGGLFGLFKKGKNKIDTYRAQYSKAETNIDNVSKQLEGHQVTLLKDVAMLDNMYELNHNYFKELTMYILAGKQKLKHVNEVEIPELKAKAEKSGSQEDAQAVNDLVSLANRFEKKIYDLELTRTISLQMGPQIRLLQNNDTLMSEKIQSMLVNTIPLWKNQMVIALGLQHSKEAAAATHAVSEMTNEMLKKNAEILKTATIETAKESERGIVDIETLKQTSASLISTMDEVIKIQDEGHQKRMAAEEELQKMEQEMRDKLLTVRK